MYLGIEIGGTKLQVGVGSGDGGSLVALERGTVERSAGAAGIRRQIEALAAPLIARHQPRAVGIGFGGPVDCLTGRTLKSHQIDGWDDYPLADWCAQVLGLPARIGNDADLAGLAEARFGAGRGRRVVFYTTVGSGIGGALVLDGQVFLGGAGIASEIGHLRPGLHADRPELTVESLASGWGIAAAVQAQLTETISRPLAPFLSGGPPGDEADVRRRLLAAEEADAESSQDLRQRCGDNLDLLSTKMIAAAAQDGNRLAEAAFRQATRALGWALGQVITLLSPEVIVVGGGVPLAGESLFWAPLREEVNRYVFPPLRGTFRILPAALGEEVVVHGALALAAEMDQ